MTALHHRQIVKISPKRPPCELKKIFRKKNTQNVVTDAGTSYSRCKNISRNPTSFLSFVSTISDSAENLGSVLCVDVRGGVLLCVGHHVYEAVIREERKNEKDECASRAHTSLKKKWGGPTEADGRWDSMRTSRLCVYIKGSSPLYRTQRQRKLDKDEMCLTYAHTRKALSDKDPIASHLLTVGQVILATKKSCQLQENPQKSANIFWVAKFLVQL